MRSLILGVAHLCTRTRTLAEHEQPDGFALSPVRESASMVQRTIEALERVCGVDVVPPALPSARPPKKPAPSWLMGPDEGDAGRG